VSGGVRGGARPRAIRFRAGRARAILRDAADGLRRNGLMAIAAVSTIAVALAVAGGGVLASANLMHLAAILEGQVEIVAFLRDGLSPAEHERVASAVRALSTVRSVTIVSKATALRRLQRAFGTASSMSDLLPSNPLPDSIEVQVSDAQGVRAVAGLVSRISGVEEVVFGTPVVDRLVAFTRAVRVGGTALAALLAAASLLIIVNTIRLTVAARRQEIEIMALVGATPAFIRGPFMVEGALQGALAAGVTTIVLAAAYAGIFARVSASLPFVPLLAPGAVLPGAVALVWILGTAVGIGGSVIGLRRYLRV
jgi:cell division transport system permease protein